jgi:hypothetical protein
MSTIIRFILTLLVILLSACATYPKTVEQLHIAGSTSLTPLSPTDFKACNALQKINVDYQGQKFTYMVQLEVSASKIVIVGLTPVYSRSFLITYENKQLNFEEHPYFKYPIKPEQILRDFFLTCATPEQLKINGGKIIQEKLLRSISNASGELISIQFTDNSPWESTTTLHDSVNGYSLNIQTLEYTPL